ncbi:PAS domain S-box protein [bacterium]|nr:PAS domain S-box protein [bacterium]
MFSEHANNLEKKDTLNESILELEAYIKDFWRFLPLPVYYFNPMHIALDATRAAEDFSGYSEAEIIGRDLSKIFAESEQTISSFKKEILEGKHTLKKKMIFLTKDKRRVPVNVFVSPRESLNGEFIGYFLAVFDISAFEKFQKELEEKISKRTKELEESRTALMNILEDVEESRREAEEERDKTVAIVANLTDGLFFFDKNDILAFINPQAEKIFNVKKEQLIGKDFLEIISRQELKPLLDALGQKIKKVFRKEITINENLTLELTTVFVSRKGEKIGSLLILHDVSREKLVERMKTEFVSIAAHQLRTPLSAIKWTLKMFLDGDLGELTKEQKEFAEKSYISNERMINLVNDLLDVSRIEEGRYLYKLTPARMERIIQAIINSLSRVAKRKGIVIDFVKKQKSFPQVKVDAEKIGLVIQNLIDNAVKYTPEKGKITVSLSKTGNNLKVEVADTGMGIPKDQQGRIFSKFFRGANALKTETVGSGLGLFIVKNIVEAHKGKIWFESEEGKGTTFFFTIPINPEKI